jgi:hypothetical protein
MRRPRPPRERGTTALSIKEARLHRMKGAEYRVLLVEGSDVAPAWPPNANASGLRQHSKHTMRSIS